MAESIFEMNNNEVEKRRVRVMAVVPSAFLNLFTEGGVFKRNTKIVEGLPKDANLIAITYDTRRDVIMMVVESESYDEIAITEVPPIQSIVIKT